MYVSSRRVFIKGFLKTTKQEISDFQNAQLKLHAGDHEEGRVNILVR